MDTLHDESSHNDAKRCKSEIWQHFSRIDNSDRAKCNYCGQTYAAHPSKNGTSTLLKHLKICKNYARTVDSKQQTLISRRSESTSTVGMTYTQICARDFVAKMIILDELPIKVVEGIGFRTLCKYLNPDFSMPSRKTISTQIRKIFELERSKLMEYFINISQRVCLTTDTWTSIQNLNYLVLTAHYIDENWKVQEKIWNFCLIPNHKGESIGKVIETCLLNWEISKVTSVTVDNASSNDVAIAYLTKTVKTWKGLILNGDYMHVRCFAHVLNLVVSDGLKEHHGAISRARKVVKYVRSSPARLQQFKECVEKVKISCNTNLCLDVATRWNSTYLMLASAIKYETAFEKLAEDDNSFVKEMGSEGPPTTEDWGCIREYIKFLEAFHTMTINVSGSLHITSNMYVGEVCDLKIALQKYANSDNMTLRHMATSMEAKFDKYWGSFEKINMLVYVAIILDPSCKTRFLKHCLTILFGIDKVVENAKQVDNILEKLYAEYRKESTIDNQTPCVDVHRPPMPNTALGHVRSTAVYSMFYGAGNTGDLNNENNISEIDRYLAEKLETFSDSDDILAWWKRNSGHYPVLSKIARDILIIPISTVASESAFSCGGHVLDAFRSSLSPKTVEALICTQSWIKSFNPFLIETRNDDHATTISTTTTIDEDCTIEDKFEDDDISLY